MNSLVKHVRTFKNFSRYISTINIPDLAIQEQVYERSDYPIKNNNYFTNKTISIIGYGPQGKGQSLNLKDNKFNVNIGVREGNSYDNAIKDGWIPNKNLFSIPEAIEKSDYVSYFLSDAGQIQQWNEVKPYLSTGKTLCFSHMYFSFKFGVYVFEILIINDV